MKRITFLLTILLIFSVLTSCAKHSTPEAAIDSDSKVTVTTYSPDSFRQKTADAASWAENNAPEGKTEEKETYACDVIINNGAAYLLSLAYSSNGLKDTYTNRIEKHENGAVSILCEIDEMSTYETYACPITLIKDGDTVLLSVLGGEHDATWGDSGKIFITYQSGLTEVVEYSFTDDKVTDEMRSGREDRGFKCKFLHMLNGESDIASMIFVSAPAPLKYGGITTRVFKLNEDLSPVSAEVINSDGQFEEKYSIINNVINGQQTEVPASSYPVLSTISHDLRYGMLSDFDIVFLKAENDRVNKVYSPLSIKYALKMLEEGTGGNSKKQITDVIGDYEPSVYTSNNNMSFANGLFVNLSFYESVKSDFKKTLKDKYKADTEPFFGQQGADYINSWVLRNTFGMIPYIIEEIDENQDFFLINTLGIDMEWKYRFFDMYNRPPGFAWSIDYDHEAYHVGCNTMCVASITFDNGTKKTKVSGMQFYASIDNYDIVNILGEDNIRKTVGDAYREWITTTDQPWYYDGYDFIILTDPVKIEEEINRYLDSYIREIRANYQYYGSVLSTDFLLYTDDSVKAFAKDLKEYDDVKLQYVCLMPLNEDLDTFIEDADGETIDHIIRNLKSLKQENFKEGVITRIKGFIPKFDFDYELNLVDDLKKIGIEDVFDVNKADLSGITDSGGEYINKALHKAKIELTQDGIKAAAATMMGGAGADGGLFDYIYEVPIEEIDLTFDKPFMFLIRDTVSGEVWFAGTVYDPLKWNEDLTREEYAYFDQENPPTLH